MTIAGVETTGSGSVGLKTLFAITAVREATWPRDAVLTGQHPQDKDMTGVGDRTDREPSGWKQQPLLSHVSQMLR